VTDQEIQRKAEEHLQKCWEGLDDCGEGTEGYDRSPAFAPFCGCQTCIVREVLMSVWDDRLAMARKEVRGETTLAQRVDARLPLAGGSDAVRDESRPGDD
jgi:hypothetical protein